MPAARNEKDSRYGIRESMMIDGNNNNIIFEKIKVCYK